VRPVCFTGFHRISIYSLPRIKLEAYQCMDIHDMKALERLIKLITLAADSMSTSV
jgi:hypothetical protein